MPRADGASRRLRRGRSITHGNREQISRHHAKRRVHINSDGAPNSKLSVIDASSNIDPDLGAETESDTYIGTPNSEPHAHKQPMSRQLQRSGAEPAKPERLARRPGELHGFELHAEQHGHGEL